MGSTHQEADLCSILCRLGDLHSWRRIAWQSSPLILTLRMVETRAGRRLCLRSWFDGHRTSPCRNGMCQACVRTSCILGLTGHMCPTIALMWQAFASCRYQCRWMCCPLWTRRRLPNTCVPLWSLRLPGRTCDRGHRCCLVRHESLCVLTVREC